MFRLALAIATSLLLAPLHAALARDLGQGSVGAANIRIRVLPQPPSIAAGATRIIPIEFTPESRCDTSVLHVVGGGIIGSVDKSPAFRSDDIPKEFFPGLPARQHLKGDFGPLVAKQPKIANLEVRGQGSGYGFLTALLRSEDCDGGNWLSASVTLFAFSDGRQVFTSKRGFLDAEILQLQSLLTGPTAGIARQRIQQIKRGGAQSSVQVVPALVSPDEAKNTVVVRGRVMFRARGEDGRHPDNPVRYAEIEVLEIRNRVEKKLTSTRTDGEGRYATSVSISNAPLDIFVLARAAGETVRVTDTDDQPWSITSATVRVARPGATVTIDLLATNLLENNTAFEVYEAVNSASRYVGTLVGSLPAIVPVKFPNWNEHRPDGSYYWKGAIHLANTDSHDWDNIHHEYGHHIQKLYELSSPEGGDHGPYNNLCFTEDTKKSTKEQGIRLAWGEGWPTFFGIVLQAELKLGKLRVPTVGDTRYTDTNPADIGIDDDVERRWDVIGEGNEAAIMRVLWGLYDRGNNAGDKVSATELWRSIHAAKPKHFSEWWQSFVAGRSGKAIGQYGAILAAEGFASLPLLPAAGTILSTSSDAVFEWKPANHCASPYANGQYSLRLYGADLTTPKFSSPFSPDTRYVVKVDDLKKLAGGDGRLYWAIVARDLTHPATGEFHGPFAEITLQAD